MLRLSEQYVRAYLRSPYASQFADAFVAGVVTLSATIDRKAMVAVAALMEPEQEKVIYLRIARRAAIDGLIDLAAFAASRAEGVEDDPRAELYSSLSNVTSGTVEDVLDKLSEDRPQPSFRKRPAASRRRKRDRHRNDRAACRAEARRGSSWHRRRFASSARNRWSPPRGRRLQPAEHAPASESAEPAAAPASPATRNRGPSKSVDATVEQAAATVAAARAKLAAIDKLLGDMPE